MIEVLVAVLVLAFGMLGFAMLQTTGLRYSQSANYRTQATNLAYDLLDQMRANRLAAVQYQNASFTAGTVSTTSGCTRSTSTVTVSDNVDRWKCRVVSALGDGASAQVTYAAGVASIRLTWGERFLSPTDQETTFDVVTQL